MTIAISIVAFLVVAFMAIGWRNAVIRENVAERNVNGNAEGRTSVTLTITPKNGNTKMKSMVLHGFLNDSKAAQSFRDQLPMTVSLGDWGHDFCGGNLKVEYSDNDSQTGYRNGDIVLWTPKNQLALFVGGDHSPLLFLYTKNVVLGRITEQQEVLDSLKGKFDVTIAVDATSKVPVSEFPKGDLNEQYGKTFTGRSYLSLLPGGDQGPYFYGNVTFEPGSRTFWHIHHNAVQVLVCVHGRGWYQEWGKPARELHPGDIVQIPAEVKHWHGAASDSWFQHIATEVETAPNPTNEFCEAVSDVDYNKLGKYIMHIRIENTTLMADMEDNKTSRAFKEMLAHGPLTLNLKDYRNMEKGAYLDKKLPTNHTKIAPNPRDIMLYEDNVFLIYYNNNSVWPYTRLGRINGVSDDELRRLLGNGNVKVTLSLEKSEK